MVAQGTSTTKETPTTLATLAAGSALAQMPSPEKIHKAWDKNADGAVDKAEWVAAGRKEERFALVDADGDGKVTVDELKTAMSKMKARPQGDTPQTPPADH
jgi:Ca2+-binding EF-hand superfamily protein